MKYKVKKDKVIETRRYEDECKEKNIEPIPDVLNLIEKDIENEIAKKLMNNDQKSKLGKKSIEKDRKLKLCEEIIENTIKQKLNRKHIKNKIKNGNKNIRNRRYPRKI